MGGSNKPKCRIRFRDPETGRFRTISCNSAKSAANSVLNANASRIAKENEFIYRSIRGIFGDPIPRTKGDHKIINPYLMRDKKIVAAERRKIAEELKSLSDYDKKVEYIDNKWIENENKIIDLRNQYDFYGKKTVQGRLLEQQIKGRVHIQNYLERIAGYRSPYRTGYDPRKYVRGFDKYGDKYPGGPRKDKRGFDLRGRDFTDEQWKSGYWPDD